MVVSSRSLRAARALLGRTQEQVAVTSGVSRPTLIRLEGGNYLRHTDSERIVRVYYEKYGLRFLDDDAGKVAGVRWCEPGTDDEHRRTQLHAARVLIGLKQLELAQAVGIGRTALTKFENGITVQPVIALKKAIREALEAQGVDFLPDTKDEGFGVMICSSKGD